MRDAEIGSTQPHRVNAAHLFLDCAQRFPERPALWVDERVWTYAQLRDEVLALAERLRAAGRGVCATLADRSLIAYCAPLACMLAGRIHVPLGVSFPARRMADILRRTRPTALICDAQGAALLPAVLETLDFALHALLPDGETRAVGVGAIAEVAPGAPMPERTSGLDVDDADIAYVLFTSGSTGTPKGVAVGHRALCAYVDAIRALYPELDEHQRCTQLFEPTFDLSMHDMFVTWAVGACLYAVPRQALMMPSDFINAHRLTVWFSVPSLAAMLQRFKQLRPGMFPTLRLALFCGEALPGPLAGAWLAAAPNARCDNIYGPTEATIACTAYRLSHDDAAHAVVPIGVAFAGMEIAVVNDEGGLCADGESGELWLGGVQLAFGYWRDSAQTAERFVNAALPGRHSRRWYRSGDRACVQPNGNALFLGRLDRQIKLRGYRIELQDVEAHLRAACGTHDAPAQVAVIPVTPPGGDAPTTLVAFVACANYDPRRAMAAMKARLPAYMLPSQVRVLDALPLNSNGKVDYPALAALAASSTTARAASHAANAAAAIAGDNA